ncbi:ras-related protein RabX-like [Octopus sinensis]|uniref:Ras-related protein RabX-like n=1 Tax=Octopus sinensis TaxID=2607531 RepID=A0A6P7SSH3_9MOLL|nr:ras-related protein RabX-like [Octopus sinensis]
MRLINGTIDTSNGIKEACEKEYERCKRNPNVDMSNGSKNGSGNDDNSNNNNNNISKTNNPNEGLNESKMNAVDPDNGETGESGMLSNASNKPNKWEVKCNCRDPSKCPVNGNCCQNNVIYKCSVQIHNGQRRTYVGSTIDF